MTPHGWLLPCRSEPQVPRRICTVAGAESTCDETKNFGLECRNHVSMRLAETTTSKLLPEMQSPIGTWMDGDPFLDWGRLTDRKTQFMTCKVGTVVIASGTDGWCGKQLWQHLTALGSAIIVLPRNYRRYQGLRFIISILSPMASS